MYGLPQGVTALNEDPYNVGGKVAWYCSFQGKEQLAEVLRRAFAEGKGKDKGFSPFSGELDSGQALVVWDFNGETFLGDVLVDNSLNPLGFCIEVHLGVMVFNLDGHHIPMPRFPSGHEALEGLHD